MADAYRDAGVDLAAADEVVERLRGMVPGIGGFGGLAELPLDRYDRPVLVASTDGVGTKALVAELAGRYGTIGLDLVAMCVDDIVCSGAEPLFMLDYLAVGKNDPDQVGQIVAGVAEGCRVAECELLGGETAEHPGAMRPGQFDLAGFAVGVVERDAVLTGERVQVGDVLVGLASPGLRCNGYSLARRLFFDVAGRSIDDVADVLLEPSVIYAPVVRSLLDATDVRAVAHITGGGIPGNLARVLPAGADAVVDRSTWVVPEVFGELQEIGSIDDVEMAQVFNLGIGMILVVPPDDVPSVGTRIGSIEPGTGEVRLVG